MSHYTVNECDWSMADLRTMFPDGQADEMNWLFLSTSGVHGTGYTLDDVERTGAMEITFLVVAPRMVRSNYGEIMVTPDDVPWLRSLVASTVKAVAKSQAGNLL